MWVEIVSVGRNVISLEYVMGEMNLVVWQNYVVTELTLFMLEVFMTISKEVDKSTGIYLRFLINWTHHH